MRTHPEVFKSVETDNQHLIHTHMRTQEKKLSVLNENALFVECNHAINLGNINAEIEKIQCWKSFIKQPNITYWQC